MQNERFKVGGMTCGGCTGKVTRAMMSIVGVADVNVSLADGEVTVHFDEQRTTLALLKAAVADAGYGVTPVDNNYYPARSGCCS